MRNPPILKSRVAFKTVKHNASWVQWCMQRAWQAEEIQMRAFSFSEVSSVSVVSILILDINLLICLIVESFICLLMDTYSVTVNKVNFNYTGHFAVSVENMLNCRFPGHSCAKDTSFTDADPHKLVNSV